MSTTSTSLTTLPPIWENWTDTDLDKLKVDDIRFLYLWLTRKREFLEDFYDKKVYDFEERDEELKNKIKSGSSSDNNK